MSEERAAPRPAEYPAVRCRDGQFVVNSPFHSFWIAGLKVLLVGVFGTGALVEWLDPTGVVGTLMISVGGLGTVLGYLWCLQISLRLDEKGIVVHNFWTRAEVPWEEVAVIVPGAGHLVFSTMISFLTGHTAETRRAVIASASDSPGNAEMKRQLLDLLRHYADIHGIRVDLTLDEGGGWDYASRDRASRDYWL